MTPSVAEVLTRPRHVRQDVLIQSGILSLVKSLYNSSWVNTPQFTSDLYPRLRVLDWGFQTKRVRPDGRSEGHIKYPTS